MPFDAALGHIRRYVESRWETLDTRGLALGLTDRERCLGVQTFGFANVDARTPVSAEHLFQIGSISKGFTAVALLQEHEAGRLDLHAPVTQYLPWFEVRSAHAPIAIHHLLTHTAGIIQGMDFTGEGTHEVWALRETETGFAPGERFWYSNVGFKTLGLVLETVTGQPWWEVVRERVLLPLGMTATDPITTHETRKRLAVGYVPRYDDRPWHPSHGFAPGTWVESATADGTICSTAEDMTAYARLLLNRGEGPGARILSEESFGLMAQRVIEDPAEPGVLYGYGLKTREVAGRTCLGHSGSTIGYSAYVLADVDAGFGVAILMNAYADRVAHVTFVLETLAAAARGDELPPVPEPPDRGRV
ncbi:MAG: beta-lactamase family protein, partial [Actinobacteria bacterium]|nr:beta-lactamase family protein [Actinomycetota bacterium]